LGLFCADPKTVESIPVLKLKIVSVWPPLPSNALDVKRGTNGTYHHVSAARGILAKRT
jgi:hypothetical protein